MIKERYLRMQIITQIVNWSAPLKQMRVLCEGSHKEIFDDQKRNGRKPEPIIKLLQQGQAMLAAGKSEAEVFQRLEITESTWQRWNSQYGGIKSDEAKQLRKLEIENQRLKEMPAEAELDKRILKTALEGNY